VTDAKLVWLPGAQSHGINHTVDGTFKLGCELPDHPALPKLAAWLAEHGAEALADLIDAGVFCLDDCRAVILDDAGAQFKRIAAGRALLTALGQGGGE
jgi:hypothetical protein